MEFILYIGLFLILLFVYGAISVAIFNNFLRSRGLSRVIWFLIVVATLSFIFGRTNSNNYSNENYTNGGREDGFDFFEDDNNEYSNCYWDDSSNSWDCDD